MKTGSKTLLVPFLAGAGLDEGFSCISSNRSGALRLRDGRERGGGVGAAFFTTAFLAVGFLGAGFSATFFLGAFLGAGLLGGGVPKASSESSSSSFERARFGLCFGARLAPMLEVGTFTETELGAGGCCDCTEEL
jgi:hypothetical protein